MRYGLIEWYCLKKRVMSTTRSRMTGKLGSGRSRTGSFKPRTGVMHARPLRPLMFMASEPHTPSRQDLRNVSVLSIALMRRMTSSSMISPGCGSIS